jgi:hypothetical protein
MSTKITRKSKSSRTIKNRISYVTDRNGTKTSVILPIKKYEELLEDLHDLAIVAERKNEEYINYDVFLKELEKNGLL